MNQHKFKEDGQDNLLNQGIQKLPQKEEKKAIQELNQKVKDLNKGKKPTDEDYMELDHVRGVQVSLMENGMGRDAFKNFQKLKEQIYLT